jgi:hypothetical protein
LAPRGELCPIGGIFTLSFTPRGEHYCLKELRGEQILSPPGGITSPLGAKVCPWGEVKNGPLDLTTTVYRRYAGKKTVGLSKTSW